MSEQYTNCSNCIHWKDGHCQIHQPVDKTTPACPRHAKQELGPRELDLVREAYTAGWREMREEAARACERERFAGNNNFFANLIRALSDTPEESRS